MILLSMRFFLTSIVIGLYSLLPVSAEAQGLVSSCEGVSCSACDIITLANNIVQWLIGIVFLFFAILAVYHGFKLVVSGGNSGAKSAAKSGFTSAFIGLFIMLGAFLVVDTIMRGVVRGSNGEIEGYGPWSKIKCATQTASTIEETLVDEGDFTFYILESSIPISTGVPSGNIQQRILSATLAYENQSTSAGPEGGNKACAWAVNNILRNANVTPVGDNSVKNVENALVRGRGARISQSDTVGGDLVLLVGARTRSGREGNHIGVCLNNGCTQVLSNSSSAKAFRWRSGPTFSPSYSGGLPRFFRVTS
jgi:Type IV secretion system pilin